MKTFTDEDLAGMSVAAEASIRITFALLQTMLDRGGGDPRLGEVLQHHLGNGADDAPGGVVDIMKTAAEAVRNQTGAPLAPRFTPN